MSVRLPGILLLAALAAPAAANTIETVKLTRPEGPRDVNFVIPDKRPADRKMLKTAKKKAPVLQPLVILLHGHSGSALQLLGQRHTTAPLSPWLTIADRDGVLLAAPKAPRAATTSRAGTTVARTP